MADNLIRTKQINQADLSGAVVNVIESNQYQLTYGGTGININNVGLITISGTDIYLIDSVFNVSGTGVFNALDLNNIDTLSLSGVSVTINGADVSLENNLTVSGNLTVAGTIRYNEIIDTTVTGNFSGYTGYFTTLFANNLVYKTGQQTINGYKIFMNDGFDIITSGETISISSGKMTRVPYGDTSKDFDINLLSYPFSNSYISMGYETGRVGQSINSQNGYRELKIWETGGYIGQWIYKMARFGPYGVILSEDDFSKVGIGTKFPTEKVHISGGNLRLDVGSGIFSLSGATPLGLPNNPLSVVGSGNTYLQLNIQNRATGNTATADLVITANNGTDTSNYINLGINNSGYNDPTFSNGSGLDGYLFINGGNLDIGTQTPNTAIEFHAGGTTAARTIARISSSGFNLVSGNLTVGNTGVLLSGSTPFVMNFGHTRNNTTAGSQYYYFGPPIDIGPVSLANNDKRRVQIMQDCYLRRIVWTSLARDNAPIPSDAATGYFKNFGNNALGVDSTAGIQVTSGINIVTTNIMYNNSTGTLNIPIKSGDFVSFYYQTNYTNTSNSLASGLTVGVNAYFYV